MTVPGTATQTQAAAVQKRPRITTQVLGTLQSMQKSGRLDVPKDYSYPNALNSAWITLQDTKDRSGRSVLETCTESSVARALMNMVYLGLNPSKNQCYFIAYGDQLTLFVSYFGKMMIAKRVDPRIEDITASVIYQGDHVATSVANGRTFVSKHDHEWGNEDPSKIIGAYATIIYRNGTISSTIMNMDQIRKCWSMGQTGGKSKAHTNTPDQMAMRTVINRACKPIINTSTDATLLGQTIREVEMDEERCAAQTLAAERTNVIDVDFDNVPEHAALPKPEQAAQAADEPEPAPLENLVVDMATGEIVETAQTPEPAMNNPDF